MSRIINALVRGDLQRGLSAATRDVAKMTANLSGANSEGVKQAASILAKEIRRLVATPFSGTASRPGEPPRLRLGRLKKSIKSRVVDGVRRVGTGSYTGRFMEFGVDAAAQPARAATVKRGVNGRRFKIGAKAAFKGHHLAPRPFMRPAFANVQDKMTDAMLHGMQADLAKSSEVPS